MIQRQWLCLRKESVEITHPRQSGAPDLEMAADPRPYGVRATSYPCSSRLNVTPSPQTSGSTITSNPLNWAGRIGSADVYTPAGIAPLRLAGRPGGEPLVGRQPGLFLRHAAAWGVHAHLSVNRLWLLYLPGCCSGSSYSSYQQPVTYTAQEAANGL